MARIVHDGFQNCTGLNVAFVASRHKREHFFQLLDHFATWLDAFSHRFVFALEFFVFQFEDTLNEVRETVVYLEKRIEVTSVTYVSKSDGSIGLAETLLERRLVAQVMTDVLTRLNAVLNCNLHLFIHHFDILRYLVLRHHAGLDRTLEFSIFSLLRCGSSRGRFEVPSKQLLTSQINISAIVLQSLGCHTLWTRSYLHDWGKFL